MVYLLMVRIDRALFQQALINQIQSPGASLLAGICILSIMILPTVALVTDSSFANVPVQYLSSAQALGLGRFATV